MWALAELVERVERSAWKRKFGTEFTGFHEGKPVRFAWHFLTVGHICMGDVERYGHLRCERLVIPGWCWLRSKEGTGR